MYILVNFIKVTLKMFLVVWILGGTSSSIITSVTRTTRMPLVYSMYFILLFRKVLNLRWQINNFKLTSGLKRTYRYEEKTEKIRAILRETNNLANGQKIDGL